jgi:hypothetical protein
MTRAVAINDSPQMEKENMALILGSFVQPFRPAVRRNAEPIPETSVSLPTNCGTHPGRPPTEKRECVT